MHDRSLTFLSIACYVYCALCTEQNCSRRRPSKKRKAGIQSETTKYG